MNLLIIRSASLERFDSLMQKIAVDESVYSKVDVLTHQNRVTTITLAYPECSAIAYPIGERFTKEGVALLIKKSNLHSRYDRAIVLASNLSGKGHGDVIKSAFIFSDDVLLFNVNDEFIPIPKNFLKREQIKMITFFPAIFFGTLFIWAFSAVVVAVALLLKNFGGIRVEDG